VKFAGASPVFPFGGYAELSKIEKQIADELKKAGISDANSLTVDYFIWVELQVPLKCLR
jgi:hypothetical protein